MYKIFHRQLKTGEIAEKIAKVNSFSKNSDNQKLMKYIKEIEHNMQEANDMLNVFETGFLIKLDEIYSFKNSVDLLSIGKIVIYNKIDDKLVEQEIMWLVNQLEELSNFFDNKTKFNNYFQWSWNRFYFLFDYLQQDASKITPEIYEEISYAERAIKAYLFVQPQSFGEMFISTEVAKIALNDWMKFKSIYKIS